MEGKQAEEVLELLKSDAERTYDNYETMLNERFDGSTIDENKKGLARELARMNLTLNPTTKDRILQHLRDTGPTCTSTLVKVMGDPSLGTTEMHALCSAMHKVGTIARADVYRRAGQDRASMVVWALSANEFEVDQ